MSLVVESVQVADVAIRNVWLKPIIGAFELCFVCDFAVRHHGDQARWANILGARIAAMRSGTGWMDIGIGRCEQPVFITQTIENHRGAIDLRMLLPPSQLAALEDMRNGGDLDFRLSLSGECGVSSTARSTNFQQNELSIRVSRSDWINNLNGARATDILLLEVPMPFASTPGAKESVSNYLRHAQEHFAVGRYDDCVGECRKVLEQLPNATPQDVMQLMQSGRIGMTKDERDQAILVTLRHYCHPPHHSEARGGSSDYSREDAKLALALTTSFAAHRAAG